MVSAQKGQAKEQPSVNGNGKRHIERTAPSYSVDPEGLLEAMEDVMRVSQAFQSMGLAFSEEASSHRYVIKKFGPKNIAEGDARGTNETLRRINCLQEILENEIETTIDNAHSHFENLMNEIREEDEDMLDKIEDDLAQRMSAFVQADSAANHIDELISSAVPAYVATVALLKGAIDTIRAERERKLQQERKQRALRLADGI